METWRKHLILWKWPQFLANKYKVWWFCLIFFSSAIWTKSDCLFLLMGTRHYEVNKQIDFTEKNEKIVILFVCFFPVSSLPSFFFFVYFPSSSSSSSTLFSLFYSPPSSFFISFSFFLLPFLFLFNLLSTLLPLPLLFLLLITYTNLQCRGTSSLSYLNQDYNLIPKLCSYNPAVDMIFNIMNFVFITCQVPKLLIFHNLFFIWALNPRNGSFITKYYL